MGLSLLLADAAVFLVKGDAIYLDRPSAAAKAGASFDSRSKLQVLLHLRGQGVQAYSEFDASTVWGDVNNATAGPLYPFGSISGKTVVFCNESGEYATYVNDELGFNNPPGLHAPGRVEAVVVGDSFAQGACVPPEASLSWRLTAMGLPAEYVPRLKPRWVFWCYTEGNDLHNLWKERRNAVLQRYLEGDFRQGLPQRQAEIDARLTAYLDAKIAQQAPKAGPESPTHSTRDKLGNIVKLGHLRNILGLGSSTPEKELIRRFDQGDPEIWRELGPLLETILARARDEAASWGGELALVYLPTWKRFDVGAAYDASQMHNRGDLLALAKRLGLPVVDAADVFARQGDPKSLYPFGIQGHYTAEGYELVARAMLAATKAGAARPEAGQTAPKP